MPGGGPGTSPSGLSSRAPHFSAGPLPPHVDAAVTPHGTLCAPGQQHWPRGQALGRAAAGLRVHMLLGTQLATWPRVRELGGLDRYKAMSPLKAPPQQVDFVVRSWLMSHLYFVVPESF